MKPIQAAIHSCMAELTQTKMIYAKLQWNLLEQPTGAQIGAFVQNKVLLYLFNIILRPKEIISLQMAVDKFITQVLYSISR